MKRAGRKVLVLWHFCCCRSAGVGAAMGTERSITAQVSVRRPVDTVWTLHGCCRLGDLLIL